MALKILSVDDSKMIHTIVGKAFKNYDVEVFYASNGVEGLAVATREVPDVIILDVTMPVMDGVETLTKLKADPSLKDIPVIMLTAEAGKENVIKIARIGIRDYIIKPFTEQLVVERVGRVIDLQPKGAGEAKVKSLDDPANILVVEDKPAIIDQIKNAVASTPWKIIGMAHCGEAIDYTAREVPDVILVSLSLPEGSAFNFFQMIRANARTKSVPVFGLSVKTAVEEQNHAQSIGVNGIITKPIDNNDLMFRLTRAMNLDTSKRYFALENNIQYVKIPNNPNNIVASEIATYIQPKLREMVDSGLNRMVLDVSEVEKIDMVVIKLMLQVVQSARELGIKFRVIGSANFTSQSKAFEETKDLEVYADRTAALANF
ncbi:MAG: response regulator [Verrucomicrobiota bacterium]